jgi:hypothetical protein
MRSGKLVIAVGGGPTAVINQSRAGAVAAKNISFTRTRFISGRNRQR